MEIFKQMPGYYGNTVAPSDMKSATYIIRPSDDPNTLLVLEINNGQLSQNIKFRIRYNQNNSMFYTDIYNIQAIRFNEVIEALFKYAFTYYNFGKYNNIVPY